MVASLTTRGSTSSARSAIHCSPHAKSVDAIYFDDLICATTLDEIELQKPKKDK